LSAQSHRSIVSLKRWIAVTDYRIALDRFRAPPYERDPTVRARLQHILKRPPDASARPSRPQERTGSAIAAAEARLVIDDKHGSCNACERRSVAAQTA
jgi:hypothetical protein